MAERTRVFAFIVYEDSAPEDWIDRIREYHVPFFISPYHDRDIRPNGEVKKAHYHVMMYFDGPKSMKQVQDISNQASGVEVKAVVSPTGYARYLCHLDDADKAQYSIKDVKAYGGIDYLEKIDTIEEKFNGIAEIQDFCNYYQVYSFAKLCDYARDCNQAWYRALTTTCAVYFREYLKSKKWSDGHSDFSICDPESGEVIWKNTRTSYKDV